MTDTPWYGTILFRACRQAPTLCACHWSEWQVHDFDVVEADVMPALVDGSDDESYDEVGPAAAPSGGPGVSALEPDDVVAWAPGASYFPSVAAIPSSVRIWYRRGRKKGASGERFDAYSVATTKTTVGEYKGLNNGPFMTPGLSWGPQERYRVAAAGRGCTIGVCRRAMGSLGDCTSHWHCRVRARWRPR